MKRIFRTVTPVVNVRKTISRQHQNLIGFSVENAENDCMNPAPYMGFFFNSRGMDEKRDKE
jgi:hypothetical protein